jgi:hypothetical protein
MTKMVEWYGNMFYMWTRHAYDIHKQRLVSESAGIHGFKYSEGTFVPFIYGTTTAGTHTYSYQVGRYIKENRKVHVDIMLQISSKDAAMAGNVYVGGLPFAAENVSNHYSCGNIGRADFLSFGTAKAIGVNVATNGNYIILYKIMDNAARGYVAAADVGNLILWLSADYTAAT